MSVIDTPFEGLLRIGAFSARLGVSESVLRAWELRYGLFTPARTPGGFRLYSGADEARGRRMLAGLSRGVAAREAARLALRAPLQGEASELVEAWAAFDALGAHLALDSLLTDSRSVAEVILPVFVAAAAQWAREEIGLARCHFAARVLETRLLALRQESHDASGPLALVGCAEGEQHTLGAIVLAMALRERGWRVAYLGANMPVSIFLATAASVRPACVVLSVTTPWVLGQVWRELEPLARMHDVVLAGGAMHEGLAARVGARFLHGGPVEVAGLIAAG